MSATRISNQLKKPIHLTATPRIRRFADPVEGYYREELNLTAEMEHGEITFGITVILPEKGKATELVIAWGELLSEPSAGKAYILMDPETTARDISKGLSGIQRLSAVAKDAIISWAEDRAKEYAKGRILG